MSGISNYTLKYQTFDQLLSDVRIDFSAYALENLIDPASLIRVARRCNYILGLRIYKTKETLLDLEKGRVRLPEDFYTVNFAMMCGSHTETFVVPQGTHLEEKLIPKVRSVPASVNLCAAPVVCSNCHLVPCGCGTAVLQTATPSCGCGATPCSCAPTNVCEEAVFNPKEPGGDWWKKPRVFLNCKGDCVEVIQKVSTGTRTYNHLHPLRFINNAQGIECGCPGLYMRSADEAWIKDGWLYTNWHHNNGCGQVYLSYEGMLEDEEGNLLVPDHEVISEFHQYALKERICENLMMQGEDMVQKLHYFTEKRKIAQGAAKAIVRTPNWTEMNEMYVVNRKAQWNKYYSMFSSYNGFDYSAASGASLSR
jgi:hypothetical protein